jgi:hypothetical protein
MLRIINNTVSGVSYAGYIAQSHECGESSTQQVFLNNIAHSINGYGAVIFANQGSFSQVKYCFEASRFTAYKCSQGGVITYNATLAATFSNMILIDNAIGGTIMIGDETNENNTQLALFKDSIIYGETDARDCKAKDACTAVAADPRECFSRIGIMTNYFSSTGKPPLINKLKHLPIHQIQSNAAYGGESLYRNITFSGFKSVNTWCGLT